MADIKNTTQTTPRKTSSESLLLRLVRRHPMPAATPEKAPVQDGCPPPESGFAPNFNHLSLHGTRSVIGVDAGAATLKLVHLESKDGRVRVVRTAVFDLPPVDDSMRLPSMTKRVAEFVSQARPRIRDVRCAVSGAGVNTFCLSLPQMPEKELAQAIQWKLSEAGSEGGRRLGSTLWGSANQTEVSSWSWPR